MPALRDFAIPHYRFWWWGEDFNSRGLLGIILTCFLAENDTKIGFTKVLPRNGKKVTFRPRAAKPQQFSP